MKVDRREVERNLPKKGFRPERDRRHIYYYHVYNGKETGISTCISHSKRLQDIAGNLLSYVTKQLKLDTTRQAVDLIRCPMDGDEYNKRMMEKGVFSP